MTVTDPRRRAPRHGRPEGPGTRTASVPGGPATAVSVPIQRTVPLRALSRPPVPPCSPAHPAHPARAAHPARSTQAARPVQAARPAEPVRAHAPLADEPPAGLGPWVPQLPEPERQLTPRVLTCFAVAGVVLLIGAAAAIALVLGAASAPLASDADALYLGSVRDNSGLTPTDVSDAVLVDTGHDVCGALEEQPSMLRVLSTMRSLGASHGWDDDDVAAVVGSAIGAYCPQFVPVVDA